MFSKFHGFEGLRLAVSARIFWTLVRILGYGRVCLLWDRLFWHSEPIDEDAVYGE